jgi:hypothetical protein
LVASRKRTFSSKKHEQRSTSASIANLDIKDNNSILTTTINEKQQQQNSISLFTTSMTTGAPLTMNQQNQHQNQKPKQKSREEREFQFAVSSITMNALFFVFNVAICFYYLYSSYVNMSPGPSLLFYGIAYSLFYINYSYKFFLFILINTKYRSEFKKIFRKCKTSS